MSKKEMAKIPYEVFFWAYKISLTFNPNGGGVDCVCIFFYFRDAISPWKKGFGVLKFRDFS